MTFGEAIQLYGFNAAVALLGKKQQLNPKEKS